jgi:pimeloyl-ACP methyl ester carboxylesterase
LPERLRARMQELLEDQTGVAFEAFGVRRTTVKLALPALVVHDLRDREVPWQDGEQYAIHWPGARLLATEGLGHARILGDPSVIAAVVGFAVGGVVGRTVVGTRNLPPIL